MAGFIGIHNMYTDRVWATLDEVFSEKGGVKEVDSLLHVMYGTTVYFYNVEVLREYAEPKGKWDIRSEREFGDIKVKLYITGEDVIADIIYKEKTIRLEGTTNITLERIIKGVSEKELAVLVRNELKARGIETGEISYRDGFRMFMAEKGRRRVAVWIRTTPITQKAVRLASKILSKYEGVVDVVVFRTDKRGEAVVSVPFRLVYPKSPEEIVDTIMSYFT